jgi:hypothetical protein
MKPKKQNPLHNLRIARERASQIKQGFFDGRFVERKEPSKKIILGFESIEMRIMNNHCFVSLRGQCQIPNNKRKKERTF